MTWEQTIAELTELRESIKPLHEIGEKHFNAEQAAQMIAIRKRCVELGYIRYALVRGQK